MTAGIDHLGRTVSTLKWTLVRLDVWLLQSVPSSFLLDVLCLNSMLVSEFRALCLNSLLVSEFRALCLNCWLMTEFRAYVWIWGLCLNSEPYVWIQGLCLNSGMVGNMFHWRAKSADLCLLGPSADNYQTLEHLCWTIGFGTTTVNSVKINFVNFSRISTIAWFNLMLTSTDDLQCDSLEPG